MPLVKKTRLDKPEKWENDKVKWVGVSTCFAPLENVLLALMAPQEWPLRLWP